MEVAVMLVRRQAILGERDLKLPGDVVEWKQQRGVGVYASRMLMQI
jgi:hypothetical protein